MKILYEEKLPGGWGWSHCLKKGTTLVMSASDERTCASLTFFNPADLSERYNMPDTLKGQFTAVLTRGHALYSDMGRIMLTIVEDSYGGHDPVTGYLTQAELERRFGIKTYQEHRNQWHHSTQEILLNEIGKYGLDQRDLTSVVNFFCKAEADPEGQLVLNKKSSKGASVSLQAEMDTLVILAAAQHPFDSYAQWAPPPVDIRIVHNPVPVEENPAWHYSDQNKRGFQNTLFYQL